MDDNTSRLIEALAAKLGTTGEKLWAVQVSWEHTTGIVAMIAGCFLFAGFLASLALTLYCVRRNASDRYGSWDLGGIFSGIAAACLGIPGPIVFLMGLASVMNPEGSALQSLLHAVTK